MQGHAACKDGELRVLGGAAQCVLQQRGNDDVVLKEHYLKAGGSHDQGVFAQAGCGVNHGDVVAFAFDAHCLDQELLPKTL